MRLLAIEECIDWITHELILEKGAAHRHSRAQKWEFLIFTANSYLLNAKKLQKLERLTGMILLQIETNDGTSKIWFGRLAEPSCARNKSISDYASGQTRNDTQNLS
ncbi:MAG: hypothetical protein M3297_14120 [Thermoproteota archaeon]|nr:hypothetical protein [Thermoproteota archaeon]